MTGLERTLSEIAAGASEHHEFRRGADEALRKVVSYDVASWASMDPATLMPTSCDILADNGPMPHDPQRDRRLFEIEFAETDPFTFAGMATSERRTARLRTEVAELSGVRRYSELLEPMGIFDEMRTLVRDRTGTWGAVTLYRTGAEAFDEHDEKLVRSASESLAKAFRHAFLVAAANRPENLDRPPGSLTIGSGGDIIETSEPAERWLDTLPESRVVSILAALWARSRDKPLTRATVAGSEGPITFHAYPRKGSSEETAVVVERPRPADLAEGLIAARGLTPRESEVTRRVLHGLSTRIIARDIGVSEYTVQDHLRAVFDKFGVGSRGELMATLYVRHYLPEMEEDATPGPYGWFLSSDRPQ